VDIVIEVGAGKVLSNLMKRIVRSWPGPVAIYSVEDPESLARVRQELSGLT
jgi:hypothetical protein